MAINKKLYLTSIKSKTKNYTFSFRFTDITPAQFRNAYIKAQSGYPAPLYKIMKFFLKIDGHLRGDVQRRIAAVLAANHEFIYDPDNKPKNIASILIKVFNNLKSYFLFQQLLYANFYGCRAIELIWDSVILEGKSLFVPISYKILPASFIYADKTATDEYTRVFIGDRPLAEYPPGKILFLTHDDFTQYQDIDFTEQGVGLPAIRYSIFKYFDYEDWAAFNEVYGIPMRIGKYDESATESDVRKLEEGVHNLGSDASAIIPESTKIEFPDISKSGSIEAFDKFREACDREISNTILSQNITSSSGKFGTYGTAVTANGVTLEVAQTDAKRLLHIVNDLINTIIKINFGDINIGYKITVKPAKDMKSEIEIEDIALNRLGIPLSKKAIRQKYNLPEPVDDDDAIEPAAGGLL
ncbi:MAG: DUF935 family protein [Archaeoglobus sp.]|nr:DUF935 family protein [Archaeoglobus sp.]